MKYVYTLVFAVILLPLTFCYLNTTDKSRVSLNLNAPKPDVTALHVAVYAGSPAEEDLILYQVFRPGTAVDLDVQAGENRIFVIWGETTKGVAKYYGKSSPIDIGSGDNEDVTLNMNQFTATTAVFNLIYYSNPNILIWNGIYGATLYEIYSYNPTGGPTVYIKSSANTSISTLGLGVSNFKVKAQSSIFNLVSEISSGSQGM